MLKTLTNDLMEILLTVEHDEYADIKVEKYNYDIKTYWGSIWEIYKLENEELTGTGIML